MDAIPGDMPISTDESALILLIGCYRRVLV